MQKTQLILPPLSLYIHIPWCVQKCPYCDFNSHTSKSSIPESAYVSALLDDLQQDLHFVQGREISSIFFGGGTPSILSAVAIKNILQGVRNKLSLSANCEITLEANPGTIDVDKFNGFRAAGINRMSIGVQSLQSKQLKALGRIHDPEEALKAADLAHSLSLNSFNLDLMHGLPEQDIEGALSDLSTTIAKQPPHISWYQLTIEPNTLFGSKPPVLPEDDTLWQIQEQGQALLAAHGYQQYEISAYAKPDQQCQHNINYWQFGDYLGIGCGAHGKITLLESQTIIRTEKVKHPTGYLDLCKDYLHQQTEIKAEERPFEFFINHCRLFSPIDKALFEQRTGLNHTTVSEFIEQAKSRQFLTETQTQWQVTSLGYRYLNEMLSMLV